MTNQNPFKKDAIRWATLIVVALITLGIVGYYWWFGVMKELTEFSKLPEVVTFPKPTVDTSDWKTYTNTFTNYQVKYPNNWQAVDKTAKTQPPGYRIEFFDPSKKDENYFNFLSGPATARGIPCFRKIKEESYRVANIKTTKITLAPLGPSADTGGIYCGDVPTTWRLILVEFERNNIQYSFEFFIFDGNLELIDNVMSTFQFLE